MPATERIPSVLMEPFLGKGHVFYTDNFYTSLALASLFLKNKKHICGTIQSNRWNYSKEIAPDNLQKSQAVFYKPTDGSKILACKYCANKDKAINKPKIVHILSTCHQTNLVLIGTNDKDGMLLWSLYSLENIFFTWAGLIVSINSYIVWAPFGKCSNGTNVLECLKDLCNHNLPENDFPSIHQKCSTKLGNSSGMLTWKWCLMKQLFVWPVIIFQACSYQTQMQKTSYQQKGVVYVMQIVIDQQEEAVLEPSVCNQCPSVPGLHPDKCFEIYRTKENYGSNVE